MEANAGKSFQMQILSNIFPRISLHCKLVPVQYREYEYGLFAQQPWHVHMFTPQSTLINHCSILLIFRKNEVVQNSTSSMEWTSFQIKWKSPSKYPAGKIVIRYLYFISFAGHQM